MLINHSPNGALQGQCNEMMKQMIQMDKIMVKNLSWYEADQLAIYNRGRGVQLASTKTTIPAWWSERDLNLGPRDFKSDVLTSRPRCYPAFGIL